MSAPTTKSRRPLSNLGGPTTRHGDASLSQTLAAALEAATDAPADTLTHGVHGYPARMHPATARGVIGHFAAKGATVLDPFCGSGTVPVEAMAAGCRAFGVDASPLAVRIARVHCELRHEGAVKRFLQTARHVAEASEARVRARVAVRAPLPAAERQWYQPHVLLELAGLREEIQAVGPPADRRAMEVLFSALVVKFSRQRAATREEAVPKRLRKGLVTEHFARRCRDLAERWRALRRAVPDDTPPAWLVRGDARSLEKHLPKSKHFDLVLSSPPYGGTYDYVQHHRRGYAWLGLDPRVLEREEVGARRHMKQPSAAGRWDRELRDALRSIARVAASSAWLVLVMGDGEAAGSPIPADAQLQRVAPQAGWMLEAWASQPRADRRGRDTRREHLLALRRKG